MNLKETIAKAAEGDADALKALADQQERVGYLETELDTAIKARDTAKGASRIGKDERTELTDLRTKAAEAEDVRLKAEGDYDALKAKLEKRAVDAEANATQADQRFADSVVETAFHGASELFGKDGLTTLTPDFALAGFRQFVKFVPGENGERGSVVVHDLKGEPILTDGKPALFAEAMERLIGEWPAKDQILRGGERAGSGAREAGQSTITSSTPRAELVKRAAAGEPEAVAALQKAPLPGQLVQGKHWERQAEEKAKAS